MEAVDAASAYAWMVTECALQAMMMMMMIARLRLAIHVASINNLDFKIVNRAGRVKDSISLSAKAQRGRPMDGKPEQSATEEQNVRKRQFSDAIRPGGENPNRCSLQQRLRRVELCWINVLCFVFL